MDVVLRAFAPELLAGVEVLAFEGSSREVGDLNELAFNRVRSVLFDVDFDLK